MHLPQLLHDFLPFATTWRRRLSNYHSAIRTLTAWCVAIGWVANPCPGQDFFGLRLFASPLQKALQRGLEPGGDLAKELDELADEDCVVRSDKEAQLICEALKTLPQNTVKNEKQETAAAPVSNDDDAFIDSALYSFASLFDSFEADDSPAQAILEKDGIPELVRIFDDHVARADYSDPDGLLEALRILVLYETTDVVQRIVSASQQEGLMDSFQWDGVFSAFSDNHPQREALITALATPLPDDEIAHALLHFVNETKLHKEELDQHPFDSAEGEARLREWLDDKDPEAFDRAYSAAVTLAFLPIERAQRLAAVAHQHPDGSVRLEAAWALGMLNDKTGLQQLADFAFDIRYAHDAIRYLNDLDHANLIPRDAQHPDFLARANFAHWLSHPNELGEPPDEVEIVDSRRLHWPTQDPDKPFWILRYRLRDRYGLAPDDINLGIVGSETWCHFMPQDNGRIAEDFYGYHCAWEMEMLDLIELVDLEGAPAEEFPVMLQQWQGDPLGDVKWQTIAKLDRELAYGAARVVVATAKLGDQQGWIVFDQERTTWYAQAEMPEDESSDSVLRIHIGRKLLGMFPLDEAARLDTSRLRCKQLARTKPPEIPPQQVVEVYERLLAKLSDPPSFERRNLVTDWSSPLVKHADDYAQAKHVTGQIPEHVTLFEVLNRITNVADTLSPKDRAEAFDEYSSVATVFDLYDESLPENVDREQSRSMLSRLQSNWQSESGQARLGRFAAHSGNDDLALQWLSQLDYGDGEYWTDEAYAYAEVLCRADRQPEARSILLDQLKAFARAAEEDRSWFEDDDESVDDFDRMRKAYVDMAGGDLSDLDAAGIPESHVGEKD